MKKYCIYFNILQNVESVKELARNISGEGARIGGVDWKTPWKKDC
jgi:hypothetical protein